MNFAKIFQFLVQIPKVLTQILKVNAEIYKVCAKILEDPRRILCSCTHLQAPSNHFRGLTKKSEFLCDGLNYEGETFQS